MSHPEEQYLSLLNEAMHHGVYREGRNGGTYGLFGRQIRFDLSDGFPLLTTKRIYWKAVFIEMLWFLRGETNIRWLLERGVSIWTDWPLERYRRKNPADQITREEFERLIIDSDDFALAWGGLGPVYGMQWRAWAGRDGDIDQLANLIDGLKRDPYGRRHIITAWNPAELDGMALPPCHCLFQFFVANGRLSCQLYQRSADLFIGVPFNIAGYALLTHLIAAETGLAVGEFVHTFGDLHLYANHVDQAKEQYRCDPRPFPTLSIKPGASVLDGSYSLDHIMINDYDPHPAIKGEVSV